MSIFPSNVTLENGSTIAICKASVALLILLKTNALIELEIKTYKAKLNVQCSLIKPSIDS